MGVPFLLPKPYSIDDKIPNASGRRLSMEAILLTVTAQPLIHRSPLRYLAFQNIKMQGTPMKPLGVPLEMFAEAGLGTKTTFFGRRA
jgi:hypothetical protein